MSFSDLGYEKAQLEIQQHEEQSPLAIQSEVKPFTTKAPVHVIEALDTVAEEFGMSRNAFVLKLLEVYLGSAYVDYQNGYGDSFNEDPHVFPVSQLEKLIKKSESICRSTKIFGTYCFSALGMSELLGEKQ